MCDANVLLPTVCRTSLLSSIIVHLLKKYVVNYNVDNKRGSCRWKLTRKNRENVGGGTKDFLINEGLLANNDAIITIP